MPHSLQLSRLHACRYALGFKQTFLALWARDLLLMQRHWFVYAHSPARCSLLVSTRQLLLSLLSWCRYAFRTMQVFVISFCLATMFIRCDIWPTCTCSRLQR